MKTESLSYSELLTLHRELKPSTQLRDLLAFEAVCSAIGRREKPGAEEPVYTESEMEDFRAEADEAASEADAAAEQIESLKEEISNLEEELAKAEK